LAKAFYFKFATKGRKKIIKLQSRVHTHTKWLLAKKNFVQNELECSQPERSKTERGRDSPVLALLAHWYLAKEEGSGYVTVAVSWQDVRQGKR
jgi:hypothetical protein